ncbi:hypothetical protein SDC9_211684 [bioreactor metagenome]|uniref:Uncharacterized protein n=1 Tax=bioreactor metagenome TaxID=1076179 RepID=A0A645JKP0_9ZZZZ
MGLRVHSLRMAEGGDANRIPCEVVQTIADVFARILLLRVKGAGEDAPLLRMELAKKAWNGQTEIVAALDPKDVLLLRETYKKP